MSKNLHPDFPIVDGTYQLTREWSIALPFPHNRRIEDGSMVLWQPKMTSWISVWGNDNEESIQNKANWLKKDISNQSFDLQEQGTSLSYLIGYRVNEVKSENITYSYNGFAISENGHVQISIYFDEENVVQKAKSMFFSLRSDEP